jgi:hypothetical protein
VRISRLALIHRKFNRYNGQAKSRRGTGRKIGRDRKNREHGGDLRATMEGDVGWVKPTDASQ